jgi:hypothetical protein
MDRHSCVLLHDIVLIALKTISSVGNHYHPDGLSMDKRFPRQKMVQDIYSSRTYVQIRRMVLVSLYGVSDLFSIMSDYSDGLWFREMMWLMTLIVMMVLMI